MESPLINAPTLFFWGVFKDPPGMWLVADGHSPVTWQTSPAAINHSAASFCHVIAVTNCALAAAVSRWTELGIWRERLWCWDCRRKRATWAENRCHLITMCRSEHFCIKINRILAWALLFWCHIHLCVEETSNFNLLGNRQGLHTRTYFLVCHIHLDDVQNQLSSCFGINMELDFFLKRFCCCTSSWGWRNFKIKKILAEASKIFCCCCATSISFYSFNASD